MEFQLMSTLETRLRDRLRRWWGEAEDVDSSVAELMEDIRASAPAEAPRPAREPGAKGRDPEAHRRYMRTFMAKRRAAAKEAAQ
jgi:hypothetical protein